MLISKHEAYQQQRNVYREPKVDFTENEPGPSGSTGKPDQKRPKLDANIFRYPDILSILVELQRDDNKARNYTQYSSIIELALEASNVGQLLLVLYSKFDAQTEKKLSKGEVLIDLIQKKSAAEPPSLLTATLIVHSAEKAAIEYEFFGNDSD
jgi:hypothetical protein